MRPYMMVTQQPCEPQIPVEKVICAKYFDDLLPFLRGLFASHGIQMKVINESCILTFPDGTHKLRFLPTMGSERYEIHLPDGWIVVEAESVMRDNISLIDVKREEYPGWAQRKYAK